MKPVAVLSWQVLELQQQLKSAQHQLRVEEARAGESIRLERDSRDLSDTLSALRAKQQEEHITRSHKPPDYTGHVCATFPTGALCRDSEVALRSAPRRITHLVYF